MFARFCKKNAIFPSSASNRNINNVQTARQSSSTSSHLNRQLPEIPLRQPPPSYWEHYNHPIISDLSLSDSSDTTDEREIIDHNAYCPDLVRNCSTLSINNDSVNKDYIEIDDINQQLNIINGVNQLTLTNTKDEINDGLDLNINEQTKVMGQNLSLRRPRISLTWVLREQQQQQQQQQQLEQQQQQQQLTNQLVASTSSSSVDHRKLTNTSNANTISTKIHGTTIQEKKKKNRGDCERLFSEKYLINKKQECINSNTTNNIYENNYDNNLKNPKINKSLMLSPPHTHQNGYYIATTASASTHNDIKLKKTCSSGSNYRRQDNYQKIKSDKINTLISSSNNINSNTLSHTISASEINLKSTYSEPSLYTKNEWGDGGPQRRHRQKKRKDRNRSQRFGYEIKNVDEFLSRCSLSSPANIPVVLSAANTLYQTRPGGYQIEIKLPLGMVVNAIFKNQNWLYVQTPHQQEGYVSYSACLPLGILPPQRSSPTSQRPVRCWENSGDVFPHPCGNMTDSEKELQLRSGTQSEGAHTPKLRRSKMCNEKNVDALYLRAASQPKLIDKSYAKLKQTNKYKLNSTTGSIIDNKITNDEYVSLQTKYKPQKIVKEQQQHQHHHPIQQQQQHQHQQKNHFQTQHQPQQQQQSLRQTLLAITENFESDRISVVKGDIVILLACKETRNQMQTQQWFYIKTRDDKEGFIPSEVAGHGFL